MPAPNNSLLPDTPIATAQMPRSALSKSDIAAPYRDMAEAMDKGGAALTEVATGLAEKAGEEAGRKSVRTADDGSLVVDDTRNPFIIGPAAKAYERAAKLTQAAQIQPKVETDLLNLRLQHQNDPAGFYSAAKTYGDTILNGDAEKGTPGIQDPHIRGAVGDFVNTNIQHNLRTSLIEANNQNTAEALQTYQAQIKNLNEQMSSVARQGGTDTPEYLKMAKDRATFWRELQADPRFKFSKERAELEINEAFSNDKVQEVIGQVQRQYQKDGDLAKAKQSLQNAFWGEGSDRLNLTAAKRDHGVAEGIKALSILTSQDREAIAENRQAVTGYLHSIIVNPKAFDEGQHGNMLQRARDIGDFKSEHELEEAKRQLPIWSSIQSMSGPERADALADMRRGLVPSGAVAKTIEQEAARVGLPPDLLKRVAQIESSGNPNANRGRDDTKYKGLFQLSPEEFRKYGPAGGDIYNAQDNAAAAANALRARANWFERNYGRAPSATELYLMHQQGEAGLAEHITHPDRPAWQNMLATAEGQLRGQAWAKSAIWGNVPDDVKRQFGNVENVSSRDFMNVWQRKVERTLVPGQQIDLAADTPTTRLWQSTIKETQQLVDRNAKTAFEEIKEKEKNGAAFMPGEIEHFTRMAVQSGDEELLTKATPILNAIDVNNKVPAGTSVTALEAERARLQSQGLDSVARQTFDNVINMAREADKRLVTAPLIEGANRGWIGAVGNLNTGNPEAFIGEMADREKKIGTVRQNAPQLGPISALSPEEGKSLATTLTTGDPRNASALLEGMRQTLTPENWRATMASEPVKNAVTEMARSNDPNRMTVGMMALDKMWTANAQDFEKDYGEHTLTRLLAWKGLQALTPEMQVERLNKADDPFTSAARGEAAKRADTAFASMTPSDVAYQLGSSFGIPLVSRIANPFTQATPAAPVDPIKADAMAAEFKATAKALYQYGVDPDTAKRLTIERLKAQWQPTRMLGGPSLMKYPPEAFYPQIGGSHDWIRKDADQFISSVYGQRLDAFSPAGEGFPVPGGWRLKGVVADQQTEQEIQRGQPPSYRLHIIDANGQDQFVRDPATGASRWRPTPGTAVQSAAERIRPQFEGADALPKGITGPM